MQNLLTSKHDDRIYPGNLTYSRSFLPGSYAAPEPAVKFTLASLRIVSVTNNHNLSNTSFASNTKYVYDVRIDSILPAAPEVTWLRNSAYIQRNAGKRYS